MAIERKEETPGSETKDYINHGTARSMSILFVPVPFAPNVHGSNMEGNR